MKIFVDVNVFIDIQRKREHWTKSFEIVASVVERRNVGYISALTPAIIYFLRKPVSGDSRAREEMKELIRGFRIVSLTNNVISESIKENSIPDFKDSIQFHCARRATRVFVTRNTRHLEKVSGQIEVLAPEDFLVKNG